MKIFWLNRKFLKFIVSLSQTRISLESNRSSHDITSYLHSSLSHRITKRKFTSKAKKENVSMVKMDKIKRTRYIRRVHIVSNTKTQTVSRTLLTTKLLKKLEILNRFPSLGFTVQYMYLKAQLFWNWPAERPQLVNQGSRRTPCTQDDKLSLFNTVWD